MTTFTTLSAPSPDWWQDPDTTTTKTDPVSVVPLPKWFTDPFPCSAPLPDPFTTITMISFACPHCPNLLWNSLAAIQMHAMFKHPDILHKEFKPLITQETNRLLGYEDIPMTDVNLKDPEPTNGAMNGSGACHSDPDHERWACSLCGDCFLSEEDAALHAMSSGCGYNSSFKEGYQQEMIFDLQERQDFDYVMEHSNGGGPTAASKEELAEDEDEDDEEGNSVYHRELLAIDGRTHRFPCPYPECDEVTTQLDSAFGHLNLFHLNVQPYRCTRCPEAFYAPSELELHATDVHNLALKINPKNGRWFEDGALLNKTPPKLMNGSALKSSPSREAVMLKQRRKLNMMSPKRFNKRVSFQQSEVIKSELQSRRPIEAPSDETFSSRTEPFIIPIYNAGPRISHTRYISKYHAIIGVPKAGTTGVNCPFPGCTERLRDTERVSAHLSADHLDLQPYRCQFCGFRTGNPGTARSHRRHSKECQQMFAESEEFKNNNGDASFTTVTATPEPPKRKPVIVPLRRVSIVNNGSAASSRRSSYTGSTCSSTVSSSGSNFRRTRKSLSCPECRQYLDNSDDLVEHLEDVHREGSLRPKVPLEDILEDEDYVTEDGVTFIFEDELTRRRNGGKRQRRY